MKNNCCEGEECSCACTGDRSNKLCELTKPYNKFDVNKIIPLVNKPKYFCLCCGRLANDAEHLCNPLEIKTGV